MRYVNREMHAESTSHFPASLTTLKLDYSGWRSRGTYPKSLILRPLGTVPNRRKKLRPKLGGRACIAPNWVARAANGSPSLDALDDVVFDFSPELVELGSMSDSTCQAL